MNQYFSFGDWVVIAAYLLAVVGLGLWFGRDQRTTRDYFLGSRNVPWWGISLSIVAAETSALTIIGVPAMAYGTDLAFLQMVLGYVVARVLIAIFLVPHYFRGEIYSPYQLFADRFGRSTGQTAAGLFLVSETLAAGVRVYVASIPIKLMLGDKLLGLGTGDPILGAIVVFVGLSLIYTYVGGVKAVIWTDVLQFGLFLIGGAYALVYIPSLVDGGLQEVLSQATAAAKLHWLNTTAPPGVPTPRFLLGAPFNLWMGLLGGTVLGLSTHGAEQLIVQRVLACRSVADGRKAILLSATLILPLFLIFLMVGTMLWVFYQHHPFQIALPEPKPGSGIKANDFIFPIFMITEVPHVLKGFLIVAILSAAMSSVSSALTSLASVSTMDFVKPWSPRRDEEYLLRFSKFSTVFWAGLLTVTAYLSRQVSFVLNAAFSLRGLTSGALVGGLILTLGWRKGRALPVVTAMLVALAVMIGIETLPALPFTRAFWMKHVGVEIFWPWYTLIGATVTVVTAMVMQRFSRPPTAEPLAEDSDLATARVQPPR
jgi:solute:Na+ symporter, SSS family